jgi:hypothetical protein
MTAASGTEAALAVDIKSTQRAGPPLQQDTAADWGMEAAGALFYPTRRDGSLG